MGQNKIRIKLVAVGLTAALFLIAYLFLNFVVGKFLESRDHPYYVWKKIESPPLQIKAGYFKLTPGEYVDSYYKTKYSIGLDGFRDTPSGRLLYPDLFLAAVGESSTVCLENPADGIWSELLAQSLQEKTEKRIKVKNFGMRGARAENILGILRDEVLPQRPDLILVYAGFNNVYRGPSMFFPGSKEWPAGYFNWLSNHYYMLRRKAADLAYGLGLPYPAWVSDRGWRKKIDNSFQEMASLAEREKVPIVFIAQMVEFPPGVKLDDNGFISRQGYLASLKTEWGDTLTRMARLADMQKNLASGFSHARWIDARKAFYADGFKGGFLDLIHLSAEGNRRLAKVLTEPLEGLIKEESLLAKRPVQLHCP